MNRDHRGRYSRVRCTLQRESLGLERLEGRAVLAAAVVVSPGTTSITEGVAREITIKLSKAPTAAVMFSVQSSNPAELTIDREMLTFTPADWRTPQKVVVSAVEDYVKDGNKTAKILTGATSSDDAKYAGKTVRDVSVKVIDSKKSQPIDPSLYQGDYTGTFISSRASGPIEATVSDRAFSMSIVVNAPALGVSGAPAYGTGTIAEDGSFAFRTQGAFAANYRGTMSIGPDGAVSARGTWNYGKMLSGTWRVDRISAPVLDPTPAADPPISDPTEVV
ncbi:MAG: hypothetical protein ACKOES_05100 [Planctomycetaceae bacterium]